MIPPINVVLDVFNAMENDFVRGAVVYGPLNLSCALFRYNIISSSDRDLMMWLNEYLPIKKLSVILVEILANNFKNPTKYKAFIFFLKKVSSLRYLSQKMEVLLG